MAIKPIPESPYISRLRRLFAETHSVEMEVCTTPEGEHIDAFFNRSINYFNSMVPWINEVFPLADASVLEVGCGTGAASCAMAQVCGRIDAYDIDDQSLAQARERSAYLGVTNVTFHQLDPHWALPENIGSFPADHRRQFDAILLPAMLEHMRITERISALSWLWTLLRPKGILVIYDTPNRLYPYDIHSFRMPFADWLPDELMLMYASRSPRAGFADALADSPDPVHTMYRLGRGASFHEFDIAIGLGEMEVLNDGYSRLMIHREVNNVFDGMLKGALDKFAPHVPAGFGKDYLELVIQKKWEKAALVRSEHVGDETPDGKRPALLLRGADAVLEYRLPAGATSFEIEVLRHPWSSALVVRDQDGADLHRAALYCSYAVIDSIKVALPENTTNVLLSVETHPESKGNQAWILGAGALID